MNDYRRTTLGLTIGGGLVAALGVLIMLAWHMGWTTVVQVHSSFAPMQYNTALGFFLCGVAALSLVYRRQTLAMWTASAVGLLALLSIGEYATGVSLGIDELFMRHYITVETSHPGRMAPNTALAFLLSSIALLAGAKFNRAHYT